ncbi:molybdopterin-guanine dinucleotide biosynthesis protein A [Stella humosa]|uniref:Molybdenum cofactor guanylyltransferase n=1 Tax=Stella humosa TaxID=94 RepID=A0A3N1MFF6_9PROT|nr:molybdenum cofactor guanylyltransferase MobA [Stella humosa]ROQ01875.1 molybdopterin-guanine dinucleotide biosynthesis protein A [Stella humosa]BBK32264.1 molybdenum cofactor guanylyltransferase [Stella humosa]
MTPIPGIVLAGGRARRMGGGDKVLLALAGATILDHVLALARPQAAVLALSANGDPARFARFRLRILADSLPDYPGPLAGLLAGLEWAGAAVPAATHLASFAGDTPAFPRDLVDRLAAAVAAGAPAACAESGGRLHPVFGLWPLAAARQLRRAMVEDGLRRVEDWVRLAGAVPVAFPADAGRDPLFNINRPEDLAAAEAMLAGPG